MSKAKKIGLGETNPLVTPIYQSSVYSIPDLDALDAIMNDGEPGFIYARDAHPNARQLGKMLAQVESAAWGVITGSGMAAKDFLDGENFAENYRNLPWDGRVYEIDPNRGTVLRTLDRDILFADGIGFRPDEALHASVSFTGEGYRYDVFAAASPRREVFGNVLQSFEGDDFRGPDGM